MSELWGTDGNLFYDNGDCNSATGTIFNKRNDSMNFKKEEELIKLFFFFFLILTPSPLETV